MPDYIPGTHILWSEFACRHCGQLPPDFQKDLISMEYQSIFSVYEMVREEYVDLYPESCLPISSFYRCTDYQLRLYLISKSESPFSVHIFGLAIDVQPKEGKKGCLALVKILKALPYKVRIGWRQYLGADRPWVHFDVGYMIVPRFSEKLREGAEW